MSNDSACYLDGPPSGLLNDSTGNENPSGQTFLYGMPDMSDYDNNMNGTGFQILPKQKRRLPMPPSLPPPRKNFVQRIMSISNFCTHCCGYSRLIVATILVVMALVSLSVVIYLVVRNQTPLEQYQFIPTTVVALSIANVAKGDEITKTPNVDESKSDYRFPCKAPCPCEVDFEVNSPRDFVCELKVKGNTTVHVSKTSGENARHILNVTGIRIPDDVQGSGRFSATWKPDGTLVTRIRFPQVRCSDEGNYTMSVTSLAGTKDYYFHIKVIDFPEDPLISMPNGLIGNRSSELQCHASTGCQRADITIEVRNSNEQKYQPWRSTPKKYQTENGGIWQTTSTLNFSIDEVNHILDNKSFQCLYSIGVKKYKSTPLLMKLVPAGYCNNKIIGCSYPHPYDCNKFITCTSFPEEKTCALGLHFQQRIGCSGECVWTNQANCNMRQ